MESARGCSGFILQSTAMDLERGRAMEINDFKELYVAELQELASVESQLADAVLRMAGAA